MFPCLTLLNLLNTWEFKYLNIRSCGTKLMLESTNYFLILVIAWIPGSLNWQLNQENTSNIHIRAHTKTKKDKMSIRQIIIGRLLIVYVAVSLLFTLPFTCCLRCRLLIVYVAVYLLFTLPFTYCLRCCILIVYVAFYLLFTLPFTYCLRCRLLIVYVAVYLLFTFSYTYCLRCRLPIGVI